MPSRQEENGNEYPSTLVQSNRLIEARCSLTLAEQRIVLAMCAQVKREDCELREIELNVGDLAKMAGVEPSSFYREAKKATRELLTKPLIIKDPKGELQLNWISSAQYIDASGSVHLSFDKKLVPYLLQLRSEFTTISTIAIRLSGQHSIRIYMLLKQYQKIGQRRFTVDEFRDFLNIPPNEYKTYYDLKRRTILYAQAEYANSDHIDIEFDFEEERKGRKVVAIIFHIRKKATQGRLDLFDTDDLPKDTIESMKYYGVSAKKASLLFDEFGKTAIANAIDVYISALARGIVKNTNGGYLVALIERGATTNPSAIMDMLNQAEKASKKKADIESANSAQKAEDEELQIKVLAVEHDVNLRWLDSQPADQYDSAIKAVSKEIPSPRMRQDFKSKGLDSLESPAIKAVFGNVITRLRSKGSSTI